MQTQGTITNLVNRYRAVLRKCNLINVFGSLAVATALVLGGAATAVGESYYGDGNTPGGWTSNRMNAATSNFTGTWSSTSGSGGAADSLAGGFTTEQGVDVTNNHITIEGGTLSSGTTHGGESLYGAANNNGITVTGGTLTQMVRLYGGYGATTANENEITITGGTVNSSVVGGCGTTGASGNKVTITGGTIGYLSDYGTTSSYVEGGAALNGSDAVGNAVKVTGGVIYGSIIGGTAASSSGGAATGNTVAITATTTQAPDISKAKLYGSYTDSTAVVTGTDANTLDLTGMAVDLTATSVNHFNVVKMGQGTLTVTYQSDLSYTTIDATAITSIDGDRKDLIVMTKSDLPNRDLKVSNAVVTLASGLDGYKQDDAERYGTDGVFHRTFVSELTSTNVSIVSDDGAQVAGVYYDETGKGYNASDLTNGTATSGTVTIAADTSSTGKTYYGAYAEGDTDATGGTLKVTAGGVVGDVYGGTAAGDGNVTGNTVEIDGGTADGDVYGGTAAGNGNVTGNTVAITATTTQAPVLTGAAIHGSNTANTAVVTGTDANTLDLTGMAVDLTAASVDNVNVVKMGQGTLTVTASSDLSYTTIDATAITSIDGDRKDLIVASGDGTLTTNADTTVTLSQSVQDQRSYHEEASTGAVYAKHFEADVQSTGIGIAKQAGTDYAGVYYAADGKGYNAADLTSGTATSGTATIAADVSGTGNTYYGAYAAGDADATGGTLKVTTGGVVGDVYGGYAAGNGNVTGNTVAITATAGQAPVLTGAAIHGSNTANTAVVTGTDANTLDLTGMAVDLTATSVDNVNVVKMGQGTLTVTASSDLSYTTIDATAITSIEGDGKDLIVVGGDGTLTTNADTTVTLSQALQTQRTYNEEASTGAVYFEGFEGKVETSRIGIAKQAGTDYAGVQYAADGKGYNAADLTSGTATGGTATVAADVGGTGKAYYGAYASGDADATGGTLKVTTGGVVGDVYGGYASGNGSVTGNRVEIDGGTAGGDVYGGYEEGTGTATGNTVAVTATAGQAPDLTGADLHGSNTANAAVVTGTDANTLDLTGMAVDLTATSVDNVNVVTMGQGTLTVTEGADLSYATIDATAIASIEGDGKDLIVAGGGSTLTTNADTTVTLSQALQTQRTYNEDASTGAVYFEGFEGKVETSRIGIVKQTGTDYAGVQYAADGKGYNAADLTSGTATGGTATIAADVTGTGNTYYGAYASGDADATGGTLKVTTGGVVGDVYGGYASGDGNVTGNRVGIDGGTAGGDVYGGYTDGTGAATGNTVAVTATAAQTPDLTGADLHGSNTANTVVVTGTEANTLDLGGMAVDLTVKSLDKFNVVTMGQGTLTVTEGADLSYATIDATTIASIEGDGKDLIVAGGDSTLTTNADTTVTLSRFLQRAYNEDASTGAVYFEGFNGKVEASRISIVRQTGTDYAGVYYDADGKGYNAADPTSGTATGGTATIAADVSGTGNTYYGAYASGNADATGGTLKVTTGGVAGDVYGGYASGNGNVTGNRVEIDGGTAGGDVYGGYTDGTGAATGNTVAVTATAAQTPDLTGADLHGSNTANTAVVTGTDANTLDLGGVAVDLTVKSLENFNMIKFGNGQITVTDGADLDYATLDVGAVTGSRTLLSGDLENISTAVVSGAEGGYSVDEATGGVTRTAGLGAELTASSLVVKEYDGTNATAGRFIDAEGRSYNAADLMIGAAESGEMTIGSDLDVAERIYAGAYAEGTQTASNGTLKVLNAKVTGDLYGGYSEGGAVADCTVEIDGPLTEILGNVHGGKGTTVGGTTVEWKNGQVKGNIAADTVNVLGAKVELDAQYTIAARNITVGKDASLTVKGDLDLGDTAKLDIRGGAKLTVDGTITYNQAADSIDATQGGKLESASGNFVNVEGDDLVAVSAATNAIDTDKDTVLSVVFDEPVTYTTAQLNTLKDAFYAEVESGERKNVQLNLVNATLQIDPETEEVVVKSTVDPTTGGVTIAGAPEVVSKEDGSTQTGGVAVVPDKYISVTGGSGELQNVENVTIDGSFTAKGLTVASDSGEISMTVTKDLVMTGGSEAGSSIVTDGDGNPVDTDISIGKGGTFQLGMAGNEEDQKGRLGEVNVEEGRHILQGNDPTKTDYTYASLAVGEESEVSITNASLTVESLDAAEGSLFVDPAYLAVNELVNDTLGDLYVGSGSVTNIEGTVDELRTAVSDAGLDVNAASTGFTVGADQAVLGLDGNFILAASKRLVVDNAVDSTGADANNVGNADVYFGNGSLLVVDAAKAVDAPVLTLNGQSVAVADGAKLYLRNAEGKKAYTILTGADETECTVEGWGNDGGEKIGETTLYASRLLNYAIDTDELALGRYVVTTGFAIDPDAFKDTFVYPALKKMVDEGTVDADSEHGGVRFLSRATDATYVPDALMIPVMEEMAALADTVGVQHTALRAGDLVADAIGQHLGTAKGDDGSDVWVTPLRTNLNLTGSFESTADITGFVVGYDKGDETGRIGVAIQGGWGNSHSEGTVSYHKDRNDFAGVSLYGSRKLGGYDLKASVGYTKFENDVKSYLYGGLCMDVVDTDVSVRAVTADVRVERRFVTGIGMEITPHAGLRYTNLHTKSYANDLLSSDGQTRDIFQIPLGVTFAQEISRDDGWRIRPYLDLGFVSAFGNVKSDSNVRFTGVDACVSTTNRIADGASFAGSLGLGVEKGDFGVGLSYSLQAGSKERDNTFSLNLKWRF